MAPYHHRVSTHHRSKRARKIKKATVLIVLIFLLGVGAIFADWLIGQAKDNGLTSIESSSAVQSSTINIFRTPYFQFQADKTWREVEQSNQIDGRYIYRSYNDLLVQHELIVEVDKSTVVILGNESTSRVLPATVEGNYLMSVGGISPHCRELISDKNDRKQQFVSYKNTEFPCDPNSGQFVVTIGQVGGKNYIEKKTVDGTRTYKITYRDSTFSPAGRPLSNIINSFQLL